MCGENRLAVKAWLAGLAEHEPACLTPDVAMVRELALSAMQEFNRTITESEIVSIQQELAMPDLKDDPNSIHYEPLPEKPTPTNEPGQQNAIMRTLVAMGGPPKNFTKARATKVGNNHRVNIFARNEADITDRIVASAFVTPDAVTLS